MTSHDLKEGFKIVAFIVLIAGFYFLIVKNEPLHDEVAKTVEEATTWSTERKLQQTDAFLFNVRNTLENSIDEVTKQVFQLSSSGTLLNSKLKASVARKDLLESKLATSKERFISLDLNSSDKPGSYQSTYERNELQNKITKMLIEKSQIEASVVSLRSQLQDNLSHTQNAGLTLIKLKGDLELVSNTNDLNNIFSPNGGLGLSKSGADELAELISDVSTINKQLKETQGNIVMPDYLIGTYSDTDQLFQDFIQGNQNSKAED